MKFRFTTKVERDYNVLRFTSAKLEWYWPTKQMIEENYNQTSFEYLVGRIAALRLQDRVELVKGFFAHTLPTLPEAKYSFVHLDCDIYSPYKQCLAYFYERMIPGGITLFDEYNDPPWPGCNKAIDEFLADLKEKSRLIEEDGYEKFFMIKE